MRNSIFVFLMILVSATAVPAATNEAVLASVTPAGTVAVKGGAVVPAFPKPGGWKEMPGKASDRYDTRHFMYFVTGEAPGIELYVCSDRRDEAPDGEFEIGLIDGFIKGFAGKAGFKYDSPVFDDRKIGEAKLKHTMVKLVKDPQILWVHGYIFVRKPSLTFVAIRSKAGGAEDLEKYLAKVKIE